MMQYARSVDVEETAAAELHSHTEWPLRSGAELQTKSNCSRTATTAELQRQQQQPQQLQLQLQLQLQQHYRGGRGGPVFDQYTALRRAAED